MKKAVIDNLFMQLEDSGAILLGAGETMVGLKDNIDTEMITGVSFYKKASNKMKNVG
jgi:chemotaxis methyl-accepting protein methylase